MIALLLNSGKTLRSYTFLYDYFLLQTTFGNKKGVTDKKLERSKASSLMSKKVVANRLIVTYTTLAEKM